MLKVIKGHSNYLKCLFKTQILRKRCSTCFSPYSEKDCDIYFQFGISEKEKFIVSEKLKNVKTIEMNRRYVGVRSNTDWWAPFVVRRTFSVKKKREFVSVACIEMYCSNCSNSKEIEISCSDLELIS